MKDHIGLILKGTEEDDNPYEKKNISIIRDLDFPNIGLLDIADQIGTTESEADRNIKLTDSIDIDWVGDSEFYWYLWKEKME